MMRETEGERDKLWGEKKWFEDVFLGACRETNKSQAMRKALTRSHQREQETAKK